MKKLLLGASVLVLAVAAVAGIGPRAKCDNEKSKLCDGLVAVYEFEEALSSASTPTLPDAARKNSFGLGDLYEPDGIDVGGGSTQAGVNNGKLGYAVATSTTPDQISGLKLWLKSDQITGLSDGAALTTWTDVSGTGNNFTGSGGTRPIYKSGILNGKAVVRFDGVDDFLGGSALSTMIANNAGTVFFVYQRTSDGGLMGDSGDFFRGSVSGSTFTAYTWDTSVRTASKAGGIGSWHIGMWQHDSGNLYASVDDARDSGRSAATPAGNTGTMTGFLKLGALYSGGTGPNNYFGGDIAEVVAYNVALSETNRRKVESFLAEKYALSIPYSESGVGGSDPDAVDFNGSTQYLHTGMDGSGSGVLGNSPWTVAFWVYPDTAGSASQSQFIWSEKGSQNGGPRYGTDIYFYNNAGTFAPRVTTYDAITNTAVTASWGSNVTTAAWHLVIATYRPRTNLTTGELTIQVDNGTRVVQSMSGYFGIQTGVGSIIGRSASGSTGYFDGRLDQLTVSAISWETADATSFWNGGAGREFPFVGN